MASVPPAQPDRIDPGSPPEKVPAPAEPFAPEPPGVEPVEPDFDEPDRGPEEFPRDQY